MVSINYSDINKGWIFFKDDTQYIRGGVKKIINQYRHTHTCEMCGKRHTKKEPLTFHHTNPSIKSMCISDMKYYGVPLNRFLTEINTCRLLCRDCHDIIDGQKKLDITMI